MIRALKFGAAQALAGRPTLQLLIGAALISTSPVFVKLTSVPSDVSAWYRVAIGGAVLSLWQVARGRWRWPPAGAWWALLLAGVFFALDLGVWHQSIHYIGPGMATLLGNFQVFVMALVGALVFRERLSPNTWLSIPLALLGLSLITGFEGRGLDETTRAGIVLGLATAVFYSGFMLSLRRAQRLTGHGETAVNLALACVLAAGVLAAYLGWQGRAPTIPSVLDGTYLVAYALVAQVFGWLLITRALGHVPASRVGIVLLLQPALSFLWDVLLFDRQFLPLEALGAGIALIAVFLGARPAR
ncbi:MAG: DMT family transporter [Pseudomonadota bacterium]